MRVSVPVIHWGQVGLLGWGLTAAASVPASVNASILGQSSASASGQAVGLASVCAKPTARCAVLASPVVVACRSVVMLSALAV